MSKKKNVIMSYLQSYNENNNFIKIKIQSYKIMSKYKDCHHSSIEGSRSDQGEHRNQRQ